MCVNGVEIEEEEDGVIKKKRVEIFYNAGDKRDKKYLKIYIKCTNLIKNM